MISANPSQCCSTSAVTQYHTTKPSFAEYTAIQPRTAEKFTQFHWATESAAATTWLSVYWEWVLSTEEAKQIAEKHGPLSGWRGYSESIRHFSTCTQQKRQAVRSSCSFITQPSSKFYSTTTTPTKYLSQKWISDPSCNMDHFHDHYKLCHNSHSYWNFRSAHHIEG